MDLTCGSGSKESLPEPLNSKPILHPGSASMRLYGGAPELEADPASPGRKIALCQPIPAFGDKTFAHIPLARFLHKAIFIPPPAKPLAVKLFLNCVPFSWTHFGKSQMNIRTNYLLSISENMIEHKTNTIRKKIKHREGQS